MRAALLLYLAVWFVGCARSDEPLTSEDRCALLCESVPADHPCDGETPPDGCEGSCSEHIAPLEGDCLTCVLNNSGWIGRACECEIVDDFGMVEEVCEDCRYTTFDRSCGGANSCMQEDSLCEGFELVEPDGSTCQDACGG